MPAAASATPGGPNHTVSIAPSDRADRAASLLREALALLAGGSAQAASPLLLSSPDRLLRLPEVQRLTGLGRSAIYQQVQCGTFPRSVKVGPRAATWSEAAVQAWIAQRLAGERS